MTDFIFLSVAFGPRYIEQQTRLHQSILQHYTPMHHMFYRDGLPYKSKSHKESLYGFKVHAVKCALNWGYKKVIWLDPACILQHPVDHWFSEGMPPVVAVKDDNTLDKMIGKKALNYYDNPDITGWHLVGGSLYVFDFEKEITRTIFDHWYKAEADGIFGTQAEQSSEKINGHRNDESCMAVAMYSHGIEPVGHDVARYNQNEDSIIIKRHFK
jgi:hypothetical protein